MIVDERGYKACFAKCLVEIGLEVGYIPAQPDYPHMHCHLSEEPKSGIRSAATRHMLFGADYMECPTCTPAKIKTKT
jgi:hypothetical protein